MSHSLPLRANLDWLKKVSKERLAELRASDASTTLSLAQLDVARRYGFSSWRAMKSEIDRRTAALAAQAEAAANDSAPVAADDPDLAALLAAVRAGDAAAVAAALTARPGLINAKDANGQAAIHVAAEWNDARLGAVLFASGADLNLTFGTSAHTAMSWAVTCNSMDFARTLAALGAKADMFCAAGMGLVDHIRAAFDADGRLKPGASRTGSSRYDADRNRLPVPPASARDQISDALYIASRNGHVEAIRELLAHDPDLSFRAYDNATALHWAYFSGNHAAVEILIAAGADTTQHDNGMNARPRAFGICTAASWGFGWLVRRLLSSDAALANERTADGRTPADVARQAGHDSLADELDQKRKGPS